jgi:hypothetical protein
LPGEPPFISRTLKLVSLALIVATVAIAATAAYSGYEEYGALTASVGGATASQFSIAISGSILTISGLNVPNKMTFPLTLELLGNVSIDNATVGNFDSGAYLIQPNESASINLSVPLGFDGLLKDSRALGDALINSSELSITTTVSAHMVPLLGINMTRSENATSGPILGNLVASLNASAAESSPDGKSVDVPLILSWQNSSPLSNGTLWLDANITQIPGSPPGSYGSGSGPIYLLSGLNQQSFVLSIPASYINGRVLPMGQYIISLEFSQSESAVPFMQLSQTVSVQ